MIFYRVARQHGTILVGRAGAPPGAALLRRIRTEYSRLLHGFFTASGYLARALALVRFDRTGSRSEPRERDLA